MRAARAWLCSLDRTIAWEAWAGLAAAGLLMEGVRFWALMLG